MLAFDGGYCPSGNLRTKSYRERSNKWRGHAIEKWQLITSSFLKCSLSNCFTWWLMWSGAPSCMKTISSILLKLRGCEIPQHIIVQLSCDRTSLNTIFNYLFKKLHRCKSCSWIVWGFSLAQIRPFWVLTCPLRKKRTSSPCLVVECFMANFY